MKTPRAYHYLNLDGKDKMFPEVAYRLTDITSPTMDYHYHNGYEIFQVWSREGYVLVEDKIYPMKPGYIYIVNSLDLHRTNPSPDGPYIRNKVTFTPFFCQEILESMDELRLLEPFMNKNSKFSHNIIPDKDLALQVDTLFQEMARENREKEIGYHTVLWAGLLELLTLIYRWYTQNREVFPPVSTPAHSHVQKAMTYISDHLGDNLTIEEICDSLYLSKYYLCHLFKKITGFTLMEYVLQKRTAEAKKLLLMSDQSISRIAAATGFNSFSIFSRTFKSVTGLAPSAYRKQYKRLKTL